MEENKTLIFDLPKTVDCGEFRVIGITDYLRPPDEFDLIEREQFYRKYGTFARYYYHPEHIKLASELRDAYDNNEKIELKVEIPSDPEIDGNTLLITYKEQPLGYVHFDRFNDKEILNTLKPTAEFVDIEWSYLDFNGKEEVYVDLTVSIKIHSRLQCFKIND